MSIDYSASGGVGFVITDEIIDCAYLNGKALKTKFEESPYEELERITKDSCLAIKEFGNTFICAPEYMAIIEADTLEEVLILKDSWIEKFNEVFGTTKTSNELQIIVKNHTL